MEDFNLTNIPAMIKIEELINKHSYPTVNGTKKIKTGK